MWISCTKNFSLKLKKNFLNLRLHLVIRNWRQWLWQVFPKQSKNILALKKKHLVTFWSKNDWIGSDAIVVIKKFTKLLDARRGSKFRNFEKESWKSAEVLSVRKFCKALKRKFLTHFLDRAGHRSLQSNGWSF